MAVDIYVLLVTTSIRVHFGALIPHGIGYKELFDEKYTNFRIV